jgi:hypothetical protein
VVTGYGDRHHNRPLGVGPRTRMALWPA